MNSTSSQTSRAGAVINWVDLYGPLAIALYFIVTTRWGAFVIPGPPYIGDIALGLLIAERAVRVVRSRSFDSGLRPWAFGLIATTLAYSLVLLATGEISTVALRDAAPYLYMVLALLAARTHDVPAVRTANLLYGALIAHLAINVAVRLFDVGHLITLDASRDAYVFLGRPDIGGALIGIVTAVGLTRAARGEAILFNVAVGATGWALVLTNQNRASFIAAVLVIGFALVREFRFGGDREIGSVLRRWRSAGVVVSVLVVVPLAQLSLGTSPIPIERLYNTVEGVIEFGGSARTDQPDSEKSSGSDGGSSDQGSRPGESGGSSDDGGAPAASASDGYATFRDRYNAWKRLVTWLHEDGAERTVTGVGFGPHYWQISEADHVFQGLEPMESNRFAHNFVLNAWARMGLIGVALVLAVIAFALWESFANLVLRSETSEATMIASLLTFGIVVVSSLGVVLEAPFGALPLWWAVGYVLARPGLTRRDTATD